MPVACGEPSVPRQLPRSVPTPPLWGFDAAEGIRLLSGDELAEDVERAAALGANAVRIAIPWAWLQPAPGGFNPEHAAKVDRFMAAARSQKLGVIATVLFTPCWASSTPTACTPAHARQPPRDLADFRAFVTEVVTRWGEGLSGLEVWNEPNRPGFWSGTAAEYVALVHAAADAVDHSPYASLPVAGGALSGSDLGYLRQLLSAGLDDWSDAVSIHPYDVRWQGPGFGDPATLRENDMTSFAFSVPEVRNLMTRFSDTDPIWITEFGYPDCPATPFCVSAARQAEYLAEAASLASTWRNVDVFLVYRLRDWFAGEGGGFARYGVLNRDGSPKAAASTLRRVFEGLSR